MSLKEDLESNLEKLPLEALEILLDIVQAAVGQDDPVAYMKRRVIADGSHLAAQATVDEILAVEQRITQPSPPSAGLGEGTAGSIMKDAQDALDAPATQPSPSTTKPS